MNFMDLFGTIERKIRGYFWKLGYLAGRAFGAAGKTVFDDAFLKGFGSIGLDQVKLAQIMTVVEEAWKAQIEGWSSAYVDDTNSIEHIDMIIRAMGPLLFSSDADESSAAMSAFTSPGWEITTVKGTNDGTSFTPDDDSGSAVDHYEVEWIGDDGTGSNTTITKIIGQWVNVDGDTVVVILD